MRKVNEYLFFSISIMLIWILKLKITFYGKMHAVNLQSVPDQTNWIRVTFCLRGVLRGDMTFVSCAGAPLCLLLQHLQLLGFYQEGELVFLVVSILVLSIQLSNLPHDMRFFCFCLIPFIFLSTPYTMVHEGYALVQQNHSWNIGWKTIALE